MLTYPNTIDIRGTIRILGNLALEAKAENNDKMCARFSYFKNYDDLLFVNVLYFVLHYYSLM